MNRSFRSAALTGFVLFLGIGIVLGKIISNFPYIEWDKKIEAMSVISWLTTIGIAVAIPFLVKKGIDDNRGIKSFLIDEVKDLIQLVKSIRDVIISAYEKGKFEEADRDQVLNLFNSAQQKVGSIQQQLEISFKEDSYEVVVDMKAALSGYKDYLTGGEMMQSSFNKVSYNFYNENNSEHSKIETTLKTLIHRMHKF